MFILANLISALAGIISIVLTIYYWLIIIRAIISWVNADPFNPIVQFLYNATEPILYPIRKIIPLSWRLGIDISPIIAFLIIYFFQKFIVTTLLDLAIRLKF
ncbi:MAG: YggT family protein [Candidatus Omnitrophota bacterium]|nr:YggT family protein [Candidatus Omnitrophota bacterium]